MGVPAGGSTLDYEGIFTTRSKVRFANITDGSSNTLMYGEVMGGKVNLRTEMAFTWMGCGQLPAFTGLTETTGATRRRWSNFNSEHTSGIIQFVLADGSVRKVSPQIDFGAYVFLSGMHDGQKVAAEALQ